MNLKPLHDRVVLKRLEEEDKTKGGIFIPESAKKKPAQGEVIAVGDGKVMEDGTKQGMNVKIGDKVLFSTYAGTEVKLDGEEYLIMREEEILGIIEK
ncbi:MAG: co-chaperone GroES [Candidatus Lernaella stagnicola]|nr:co-chaperone GroES [Candidatus Lernaella stagnicola]